MSRAFLSAANIAPPDTSAGRTFDSPAKNARISGANFSPYRTPEESRKPARVGETKYSNAPTRNIFPAIFSRDPGSFAENGAGASGLKSFSSHAPDSDSSF